MMKLKLDRNLRADDDGAILFGLVRIYRARSRMVVQLHPIRWLVLLGCLAIVGYIGAVSAAYYVRSQRPYNQIQLADIALPWRWPKLDEKAGQTNLEHGKALFEDKEFGGAMHMLRAGLKRAPADHDARFKLAQIFHGAGLTESATTVLANGLDYGYPEEDKYTKMLLLLLAMQENFEEMTDATAKLRTFPEIRENEEQWNQLAELELKFLKKNRDFQGMLDYANEMQAEFPDDFKYKQLEILSLIMLGFLDEADAELDTMTIAEKHSPQYWYLQSIIAIQLDDLERVDELTDRIMRWPTNPYPLQLQLIMELDEAQLTDRYEQATNQYIDAYSTRPEALMALLKVNSDNLSVEQIDRIIADIREHSESDPAAIEIYAIQSRLYVGRGQEAAQILKEMMTDERLAAMDDELAWMRQLVTVVNGQGQNDRKALWDISREKRLPVGAYITSVRALLAVKDGETALRVAENGLHYYPHNQELANLRQSASQTM
ncbi:MAG: tetratricopeptide repeat protein [Puniceicoccales bacterium]